MNKVILIARPTKDIEMRQTSNGTSVANFTLAVNRQFKNQSGEYEADFISCVAFRGTADILGKYVVKGQLIAVEGRIQTRSYENNEGNRVYVTEVVVENVQMLERKEREENPEETKETVTPIEVVEDDLPF